MAEDEGGENDDGAITDEGGEGGGEGAVPATAKGLVDEIGLEGAWLGGGGEAEG